MAVTTTTHLNFRGDARAALEFYRQVFGGTIALITYQDAQAVRSPEVANEIMWGEVRAENGFHIMAYDVPEWLCWNPGENPVYVSVRGDEPAEITGLWQGLTAGATIVQDLAPAEWSPLYGMLRDRFGVVWVLDVAVAWDPD